MNGMDDVAVQGVPASLIAAYAQGSLHEHHRDHQALRTLATALDADLRSGRWAITATVYQLYAADVARWLGVDTRESDVVAGTIADVWTRWQTGTLKPGVSGRSTTTIGDQRWGVVWKQPATSSACSS